MNYQTIICNDVINSEVDNIEIYGQFGKHPALYSILLFISLLILSLAIKHLRETLFYKIK